MLPSSIKGRLVRLPFGAISIFFALIAMLVGYSGKLDIDHPVLRLRGGFPAVTMDVPLVYARSGSLMAALYDHGPIPLPLMSRSLWECDPIMQIALGKPCIMTNAPIVDQGVITLFPFLKDISHSPIPDQEDITIFPFLKDSSMASDFFSVTFSVYQWSFITGLLHIEPGRCIASIYVNGKALNADGDFYANRCLPSSYDVNILPYLHSGSNKVTINALGGPHRYGIDIVSLYPSWVTAVIIGSVTLSLASLAMLWVCRSRPSIQALHRYITIACMPFSSVAAVFLAQAVLEGKWTWLAQHNAVGEHIPRFSVECLPIPLAFCLFLSIAERDDPLILRFSPWACVLSTMALSVLPEMDHTLIMLHYIFTFAIVASLFILIPFGECMKRALANPRLALVAVVAGSSAFNYYWLTNAIWKQMCAWTTELVYAILHLFGTQVHIATGGDTSINLLSPYFNIEVYIGCSGLEGIFLFLFMLSVLFLVDWEAFRKRRLLMFYAIGIIYMFLVNALRIAVYFVLGYWAYNPRSWEWVQSLQDAPLVLFHTYFGWAFYLGAFWIFATCLYAKHRRQVVTFNSIMGATG